MLQKIRSALSQVRGVVAVVIGGSRAPELQTARTDFAIGVYADANTLDFAALPERATCVDDTQRSK